MRPKKILNHDTFFLDMKTKSKVYDTEMFKMANKQPEWAGWILYPEVKTPPPEEQPQRQGGGPPPAGQNQQQQAIPNQNQQQQQNQNIQAQLNALNFNQAQLQNAIQQAVQQGIQQGVNQALQQQQQQQQRIPAVNPMQQAPQIPNVIVNRAQIPDNVQQQFFERLDKSELALGEFMNRLFEDQNKYREETKQQNNEWFNHIMELMDNMDKKITEQQSAKALISEPNNQENLTKVLNTIEEKTKINNESLRQIIQEEFKKDVQNQLQTNIQNQLEEQHSKIINEVSARIAEVKQFKEYEEQFNKMEKQFSEQLNQIDKKIDDMNQVRNNNNNDDNDGGGGAIKEDVENLRQMMEQLNLNPQLENLQNQISNLGNAFNSFFGNRKDDDQGGAGGISVNNQEKNKIYIPREMNKTFSEWINEYKESLNQNVQHMQEKILNEMETNMQQTKEMKEYFQNLFNKEQEKMKKIFGDDIEMQDVSGNDDNENINVGNRGDDDDNSGGGVGGIIGQQIARQIQQLKSDLQTQMTTHNKEYYQKLYDEFQKSGKQQLEIQQQRENALLQQFQQQMLQLDSTVTTRIQEVQNVANQISTNQQANMTQTEKQSVKNAENNVYNQMSQQQQKMTQQFKESIENFNKRLNEENKNINAKLDSFKNFNDDIQQKIKNVESLISQNERNYNQQIDKLSNDLKIKNNDIKNHLNNVTSELQTSNKNMDNKIIEIGEKLKMNANSFNEKIEQMNKNFNQNINQEIERNSKNINESITNLEKNFKNQQLEIENQLKINDRNMPTTEQIKKIILDTYDQNIKNWISDEVKNSLMGTKEEFTKLINSQLTANNDRKMDVELPTNNDGRIDDLVKQIQQQVESWNEQRQNNQTVSEHINNINQKLQQTFEQMIPNFQNEINNFKQSIPNFQNEINKLKQSIPNFQNEINQIPQKVLEGVAQTIPQLQQKVEEIVNSKFDENFKHIWQQFAPQQQQQQQTQQQQEQEDYKAMARADNRMIQKQLQQSQDLKLDEEYEPYNERIWNDKPVGINAPLQDNLPMSTRSDGYDAIDLTKEIDTLTPEEKRFAEQVSKRSHTDIEDESMPDLEEEPSEWNRITDEIQKEQTELYSKVNKWMHALKKIDDDEFIDDYINFIKELGKKADAIHLLHNPDVAKEFFKKMLLVGIQKIRRQWNTNSQYNMNELDQLITNVMFELKSKGNLKDYTNIIPNGVKTTYNNRRGARIEKTRQRQQGESYAQQKALVLSEGGYDKLTSEQKKLITYSDLKNLKSRDGDDDNEISQRKKKFTKRSFLKSPRKKGNATTIPDTTPAKNISAVPDIPNLEFGSLLKRFSAT